MNRLVAIDRTLLRSYVPAAPTKLRTGAPGFYRQVVPDGIVLGFPLASAFGLGSAF